MPKGIAVPNAVRKLVYELLDENEKLTGKALKKRIEQAANDDEELRGVALSERTYQLLKKEMLVKIRQEKDGAQDKPWCAYNYVIGGFQMPPEALPVVLETMVLYSQRTRKVFTNRHAKWVALLHCAIRDLEKLAVVSKIHAENERLTEATGIEDDEVMLNASLYHDVTGNVVMVSIPISKVSAQIGPVPSNEYTLSYELEPDRGSTPYVGSHIVELKEAQHEKRGKDIEDEGRHQETG